MLPGLDRQQAEVTQARGLFHRVPQAARDLERAFEERFGFGEPALRVGDQGEVIQRVGLAVRIPDLAAELQAALLELRGLVIIGLKLRPPAGDAEETGVVPGIRNLALQCQAASEGVATLTDPAALPPELA